MISERLIFFILLGILMVAGIGSAVAQAVKQQQGRASVVVASFEECVRAGNVVRESYPVVCVSRDGTAFTQDIGNELEKRDLIRVTMPRPDEIIKSPISISGEARGFWFFEASFPVYVLNDTNEIIGVGFAQADDEWMTEDFVPWSSEVRFDPKDAKNGFVVLKKDNPSGLPEHDDELRIPVRFE